MLRRPDRARASGRGRGSAAASLLALVASTESEAHFGPQGAPVGAFEPGIGSDFLDIRPEDIRVEAGIIPVVPPPYTAPPPPSEPEEEWRPEIAPDEPSPVPDVSDTAMARRTVLEPIPVLAPGPAVTETGPEPEPEIPAIQTSEPLRVDLPRRVMAPPPRSRDLVIPRSLVSLWSLLVLSAVGFAFISGLLAGHFIWRVH